MATPSAMDAWLCRNPEGHRAVGDRIKHVHLKDSAGLPGRDGETFIFPLLGEGQVDWVSFFAAMHMLAAARISWENIPALISQ
jgi:sugar phosphate isomerase/epimerase